MKGNNFPNLLWQFTVVGSSVLYTLYALNVKMATVSNLLFMHLKFTYACFLILLLYFLGLQAILKTC